MGEEITTEKVKTGKKKKIILAVIAIMVLIMSVVVIWQLTTPKEDKRKWFTEEAISVSILMYLNENGYDYEDIRYLKTEKVRTSSNYILYETTGQLRELIDWLDFTVDVKVYADKVETLNFQIE